MTSAEIVVMKFDEWVKTLYLKNKTAIPEYALEIVRAQIHKRFGSHTTDMNDTKIARLLREINFEEYYGKETEILHALETKAIPEISPKCKERMKQNLVEMQPAYHKFTKNSHISFNYVMYKICQLFEQTALLPHIKLSISHEKLYKYDRTWHLICDEMKWYFIKSDPTICMTTPQPSPLLMGLISSVQLDRDLEEWQPDEILKLKLGVEKNLSLEQLAVGHNRSLKNVESKLKELVVTYHESKTHDLESIKMLTGLSEDMIVDIISRHEVRKSRSHTKALALGPAAAQTLENTIQDETSQKRRRSNDHMKEMLEVMKDIQTMMRYLINKHG